MAKKSVLGYLDALKEHAQDITKAFSNADFDKWQADEGKTSDSLRKSYRLDEKAENLSSEVSYNQMKTAYDAVIAAFQTYQKEHVALSNKLTDAEIEIATLKEMLGTSVRSKHKTHAAMSAPTLPLPHDKGNDPLKLSKQRKSPSAVKRKSVSAQESHEDVVDVQSNPGSARKSKRLAGKDRKDYQQLSDQGYSINSKEMTESVHNTGKAEQQRTKYPVIISDNSLKIFAPTEQGSVKLLLQH